MRRMLPLLLAAACASPPQFTELAPPQLAEIPARYCADFFLVATRINGQGPYQLLPDTGASSTVLDPSVHRASIDRLEVDPLTVRHVPTITPQMGV